MFEYLPVVRLLLLGRHCLSKLYRGALVVGIVINLPPKLHRYAQTIFTGL